MSQDDLYQQAANTFGSALDRLGPTIHHRRSFSPVAIAFGELTAKADDLVAGVLPL